MNELNFRLRFNFPTHIWKSFRQWPFKWFTFSWWPFKWQSHRIQRRSINFHYLTGLCRYFNFLIYEAKDFSWIKAINWIVFMWMKNIIENRFWINDMLHKGASADSGSSGFGAPSAFGNQGGQSAPGQSSFGGQANNFGSSGGSSGQCMKQFIRISKKRLF